MHLSEPHLSEVLKNGSSKFANILVAAKRAKELKDGADPLLEEYDGIKDVSKALQEVAAGKIEPNLNKE
ncbi:DNA-directed RNA polymerase, omega subunit [Halobacteroides halobius DSM 5150]|uniref:DNA-directed RNA polymerase subunit omega n=1 Tax=Halobacteroides halobius (strain ATCC 35273 / DSM 5150 / MD-1) TaxID=748449 RepID=L0K755_HALHC|nr:DNA-directed RNA polymerase subunit omega [Halobacteroides halobius]AGB40826.1 DNA-directed RNA polymerase, omega subunit [Halobacteroides halobius DSM 5150]